MMLELLGTRIISPYYGGGLYVWSSLITVTLVSLSLGYWLGGFLSDRVPRADLLYILIFLSAITVVFIPVLAPRVAGMTIGLGVALGTLSCSFILFSIPLLLLAMVTPYALKLEARKFNRVGLTAGKLYAVSTLGSFAGTILTGFLLIPNMGVRSIALVLAAALWVVSGVYFLMVRRLAPGGLMLLFSLLSLLAIVIHPSLRRQEEAVYRTDSFYGQLKVVDVGDDRYLLVDGAPQTVIDKRTNIPLLKYVHYMKFLRLLNPEAKSMLIIGAGGGSIPQYFQGYGLDIDLVEIDRRMGEVAERFFGFRARTARTYFEDGRFYIQRTKKRYDYVVLDVYSGDAVPFHLFTVEVFSKIDTLLNPGGVLALNLVGFVTGRNSLATKSVHRTLRQVFPVVDCYFTHNRDELGNVLLFASSQELEPKMALDDLEDRLDRLAIEEMAGRMVHFPKDEGIVLTDDYNPMEVLTMGTSRAWRQEVHARLKAQLLR